MIDIPPHQRAHYVFLKTVHQHGKVHLDQLKGELLKTAKAVFGNEIYAVIPHIDALLSDEVTTDRDGFITLTEAGKSFYQDLNGDAAKPFDDQLRRLALIS